MLPPTAKIALLLALRFLLLGALTLGAIVAWVLRYCCLRAWVSYAPYFRACRITTLERKRVSFFELTRLLSIRLLFIYFR